MFDFAVVVGAGVGGLFIAHGITKAQLCSMYHTTPTYTTCSGKTTIHH